MKDCNECKNGEKLFCKNDKRCEQFQYPVIPHRHQCQSCGNEYTIQPMIFAIGSPVDPSVKWEDEK